jgi:glucose/arabinose dehydrogenase
MDIKRILYQLLPALSIGTMVLSLNSCKPDAPEYLVVNPTKEVVMDSLAHPWSMAFINEQEAIVSEKDGDLVRVNLTIKKKYPIKGFPDDLFKPILIEADKYPPGTYPTSLDGRTVSGNGGLLDVLLHPDFEDNHQIYVSYVSQQEMTFALKVIKATLVDDSLSNIITIHNPGPYVPGIWHFGGGLCILDDHLYITAGERLFYEHMKQGLPIAQDVTDARGAIYRLKLDGSIPEDNPDLGDNAVPGIYAFGIRAAQGITNRPGTKDIWFSEHGTNQGDELNLLRPGANYGWPNITTGTWRSEGYEPDELPDPEYTAPRHYWLQTVAPTGLTFYTGTEFPNWRGNLIVPGLSRGSLWRMVLKEDVIVSAEELFLDTPVRSRKVVQSPEGQLYLLTDQDNGKLIRITNQPYTNDQ